MQLWPDYIYSIVRLLRPEHVIEQWQEQQAEAAERAAAAAAAAMQSPAVSAAEGQANGPGAASPAAPAGADVTPPEPGMLPASAAMKQPSGQVGQARFALTSAFLEKAIEQLVGVYRDAPLDVRATTFASLVSGLGRCMEVRVAWAGWWLRG